MWPSLGYAAVPTANQHLMVAQDGRCRSGVPFRRDVSSREADVEAGVAAGDVDRNRVVDAQPGAFHEPQPEAVQEAPIMNRPSST